MAATAAVGVLDLQLRAAGLPIAGASDLGAGVSPRFTVQWTQTPTAAQQSQADSIVAAFDGRDRTPRPLYAIYQDLQALTSTQKNNVWADLSSGTPKKYLLDTGPSAAAIGALDWSVTDSGASGNSLTAARLRIAAAYVQDNPGYLVQPSFDATINVAGDQPV